MKKLKVLLIDFYR